MTDEADTKKANPEDPDLSATPLQTSAEKAGEMADEQPQEPAEPLSAKGEQLPPSSAVPEEISKEVATKTEAEMLLVDGSSEKGANEAYSTHFLTGGRLESGEGLLSNLFIKIAGTSIDRQLREIYVDRNPIEAGLHFAVNPIAFVLASVLEGSRDPKCAKFTTRGRQVQNQATDKLTELIERYKEETVLAVMLDEKAADNKIFWGRNKDFGKIDAAAKDADLALVVICDPASFSKFKPNSDVLQGIRDHEFDMAMNASDAFRLLLETCGPPGVSDGLQDAPLNPHSDLFASAFDALATDSHEVLRTMLEEAKEGVFDSKWQDILATVVLGDTTREPAAASALFLGANYPGLPFESFRRLWGFLYKVTVFHWDEPIEPRNSNEALARRWRPADADAALSEIGLEMKSGQDGIRRCTFGSSVAAGRYAELLASRSAPFCEALFEGLLYNQPLEHGAEFVGPFSKQFASFLRGRYGNDLNSGRLAELLVFVIRDHRRSADSGSSLLEQLQPERLSEEQLKQLFLLETIKQHFKEQERDEHLFGTVPEFVIETIESYRMTKDRDTVLRDISAVWEKAKSYFDSGHELEARFWRTLVTGLRFRVTTADATRDLGELYEYDAGELLGFARNAGRGIYDTTLVPVIISASVGFGQALDKRQVTWNAITYSSLLEIWMHESANVPPHALTALSGEGLIEAIAPVLFSKNGARSMEHISRAMIVLSEKTNDVRAREQNWDGVIARKLNIAYLRMIFGLKGKEFNTFAREVDGPNLSYDYWDVRRWASAFETGEAAEFQKWHRKVAQTVGPAVFLRELQLSDADPAERLGCVLDAAPDAQFARALLHAFLIRLVGPPASLNGSEFLKAWTAIGKVADRRPAFERLKVTTDRIWSVLEAY